MDIVSLLSNALPFAPNGGQRRAMAVMARFVDTSASRAALVLRGYAGTGKTSLVSALVRCLRDMGRDVVLLAPTGRAAKVFARYSGERAFTIHKMIYRQHTFDGEDTMFSLDRNRRRNAIFIVDEASMISDGGNSLFGSGCLLDDLVAYVYAGAGCRLMLVGDTAQLPPVGEDFSPALSACRLRVYGLRLAETELDQVMRQESDSGVLANATMLRGMLEKPQPEQFPIVRREGYDDLRYLSGADLVDEIESCYGDVGGDETIVVTRSNKRAIVFNMGIRARIFGREESVTVGDRVMVAKNNYHWTGLAAAESPSRTDGEAGFIANGDIAEILELSNFHGFGGFRFADALLRFPDYNGMELQARLLLDTLESESPSLTRDESTRLYTAAVSKFAATASRRERMKMLRADPHYNALQIKYAYAVTCHKAQGGQWARVFLDQGLVTADMLSRNYIRWLYTAFTRTTERLYLLNWPQAQRAESDDWDF